MNKTRLTRQSYTRPVVLGVVAALFICFIGFGSMWLFWLHESKSYVGDKGFFFWRAATWGDGLCLPVLVGALVAYRLVLGEISKRQKATSYILGSILGLIGGAVQASWVISDTVKPNWTIPEVHKFMPSGWYHAGYFVFMFLIIGALMCQVFAARRNLSGRGESANNKPIHLVLLALVWFSGLGYLYMHNIDDFYSPDNYQILTIVTLLSYTIFASLFCLCSTRRKLMKATISYDIVSLIAGTLSALGFGLSVYRGTVDLVAPIICGLLSASFISPKSDDFSKTMFYVFFTAIPTFIIATAVQGSSGIYIFVFALFVVFAPLIIPRKQNDDQVLRTRLLNSLIGLSVLILIQISLVLSNSFVGEAAIESVEMFCDIAISIISGALLPIFIKAVYAQVQAVAKEKRLNASDENCKRLARTTIICYTLIGMVGLGVYTYIVRTLWSILLKENHPPFYAFKDFTFHLPAIITFCVGFFTLLLLGFSSLQLRKRVFAKVFSVILLVVVYSSLSWCIIKSNLTYFTNTVSVFNFISVVGIILISIFIATGIYSNFVGIPRSKINREAFSVYTIVIALVLLIGTIGSLSLALCFPNMNIVVSPTWDHFIVSIAIIVMCLIIIPVLAGRVLLRPSDKGVQASQSTPLVGIGHDGFLITFVAIAGILTPLFIASMDISNIPKTLLGLAVLLVGMYSPLAIGLENNAKQMKDLKEDFKEKPENWPAVKEISIHTRRQNIIVVSALLPWSILLLIVECIKIALSLYSERMQSSMNPTTEDQEQGKSIWNVLLDTYLPEKSE